MARGPFQGTFQPNLRPTVVTGPDALVYINGEMEVVGCPNCSKSFDLNKFITSIQTDLNIDSPPGSATISLSVPRHSIDDFFFDGNPIISPMMEIEIFAKGYYLLEGLPQYYPIFWGMVTEVSDSYSGGEHQVSIQCADILKWWELCQMNQNSATTGVKGQLGYNIHGNVFFGANPYDIIWSLAFQSFGDIVVAAGNIGQNLKEKSNLQSFNAAKDDLMLYWTKRFSRLRSNLLLYGTRGIAVRGDSLYATYSQKGNRQHQHFASQAVRDANGGEDGEQLIFNPTDPKVTAVRGNINIGADMFQHEFQPKLEIANMAKESIGYEFFMDVTGDIVFKPPFYNLDVFANKPHSWIQDIDIIDWDFSESEAEVVTQIIMQGSYTGNMDYNLGPETNSFATVTDYNLLRKYGWRSKDYNSEFLGSSALEMYFHGLDVLDRINSRRHRGSVSIPMRPELRLGFPVYVAPKDQIWYTQGISHNIAFGGRAQTQLTLTAKRSKFIAPRGTATLTLKGPPQDPPPKKKGVKNKVTAGTVVKTDGDENQEAFKYTSKQLARGGQFELALGDAASMPANPNAFENSLSANSPYAPLVLRHPKTGRIVGYPNAVMVYTRPFTTADVATAAEIQKLMGQKPEGQNQASSKKAQRRIKEKSKQNEGQVLKFTVQEEDALRDRHLNNRYQHGLNNAGVFVYAHDTKGVISELVNLPSKNVTIVPAATAAVTSVRSNTGLIRPVSDERGFEVIGHFRYGRRVSLRDGRLILDDPTNKVAVEFQLGLSGGLFETLTAQSQGLTAIASDSTGKRQSPAEAITRLEPEGQQTGILGLLDTTKPKFVEDDSFIGSGAKNTVEDVSTGESPEATQLSRALTLAEMKVRVGGGTEEDCPCVLGRQDLAFMNTGYQIKTLSNSSADNSGLFRQGFGSALTAEELSAPIQTGREGQIRAQANAVQGLIDSTDQQIAEANDRITNVDGDPTVADRQRVTDLRSRRRKLEEKLAALEAEIKAVALTPQREGAVFPAFASSREQLGSKVDSFLSGLYQALDTDHQEFERAIRGELLPKGSGDDANEVRFGSPPPESAFAPPFSAPNRFQLGDTSAAEIVDDIKSNADNLSKAWGDFGNKLKNNAKRTELETRQSQASDNITRLTKQRNELQKQLDAKSTVLGVNLQDEIDKRNKRIAELEQQLANDRLELQQL